MHRRTLVLLTFLLLGASIASAEQRAPSGRAVIAWHVTIAPSWFDPSTAPPQITPFGMLYAIHDALVRPYPGQKMGPSLAESWSESEDGLVYEFKLRPNLKFHNGDPLTTEDVKFSFDRYTGAAAKTLHEHVKEVEIVDPRVVRFHLNTPWPDFMTFFGTTASGAGLILPKKYLTEVGDDGFKKHPIGAGPYRFSSTKPGIEVVLEAFPDYWRRVPNVKTLVMRSVPEATTRALMVRTGEADIGIALDGPDAEGLQKAGHPDRRVEARLDLLDRVPQAMGPQVAVARSAVATGGELRNRPCRYQPRRMSRLLPAGWCDRAAGDGIRPAGAAHTLRSRTGEGAAG